MLTGLADRLIDDYLAQVADRASSLAPEQRADLTAELREHIATLRAESGSPDDEATVRTILDQLGEPRDIAAAAANQEPARSGGAPAGTWQARGALLLLLLGGLVVPVVGWVVGVVLLWSSHRWSSRQKLAGTLLTPGGFGSAILVLVLKLLAGSTGVSCDAIGQCQDAGVSLYVMPAVAFVFAVVSVITVVHLARSRADH